MLRCSILRKIAHNEADQLGDISTLAGEPTQLSPAQPTHLNPALQSHSHMPRRYDGCPRTGYCLSPLRMSPPRLPRSEGAR